MTDTDVSAAPNRETRSPRAESGWFGRLVNGQTSVDFWGRRRRGYALSLAFAIVTLASLAIGGLSLGIDFEGGVAYDVSAANLTTDEAETVLSDNGVDPSSAKIQERSSDSGSLIKIQISDQPDDVREQLRTAFAEAAQVDSVDVSVAAVSSSWGEQITRKAITALVVFLVLVTIFISIRFEWRMALAALVAMIHDVVISVGVYSVFRLEVTPETVIAFLTILGYSLYDTIVVFDKVRENTRRLATTDTSPIDIVNMSVNQVLLRSLNTSFSAVLPVMSLLVIGAGFMGVVTLRQFAIALLVGMVAGAYSSLFIASPMLASLRARSAPTQRGRRAVDPYAHRVGADLRSLVVAGAPVAGTARRARRRSATVDPGGLAEPGVADVEASDDVVDVPGPAEVAEAGGADAASLLSHPPRPRKKRRN